jgi:hypothetical protein
MTWIANLSFAGTLSYSHASTITPIGYPIQSFQNFRTFQTWSTAVSSYAMELGNSLVRPVTLLGH